jgi:hypothetical protein
MAKVPPVTITALGQRPEVVRCVLASERVHVVLSPNADGDDSTVCYLCGQNFVLGSALVEVRCGRSVLGFVCDDCLRAKRHRKLPSWEAWRSAESDDHVYCDACGLQFRAATADCCYGYHGAIAMAGRLRPGADQE